MLRPRITDRDADCSSSEFRRPTEEGLRVMVNSTDQRTGSTYRSVAALAADIGLSERSTRSALRRGEIPHIRVGRRIILPKAAIAEWLRSAGRTHQAK